MTQGEFVKMMIKGVEEAVKDTAQNEVRRLATSFKTDLTDAVRQQRYPMQELSDRWKQKKEKEGLDKRKLIASQKYLPNIRVRKIARKGQTGWVVEPTPFRVQKYKFQKKAPKITYQQLATIHEYGWMKLNIPPRPHWFPTIDRYQMQGEQLSKQVQDAFAKRLARYVARNMK